MFLRHFGCIVCRSHAQDVWNKREVLERGGAKIRFIGNGAPTFIQGFRTDLSLGDAPIYTDPTLRAFALAGFKHGIQYLVKPESAMNMAALAMNGHRNGNPFAKGTGSNRQLGGVLVVHPGDKVSYHYISESVGDVPDAESIENSGTPESNEGSPSAA